MHPVSNLVIPLQKSPQINGDPTVTSLPSVHMLHSIQSTTDREDNEQGVRKVQDERNSHVLCSAQHMLF